MYLYTHIHVYADVYTYICPSLQGGSSREDMRTGQEEKEDERKEKTNLRRRKKAIRERS